MNSKELSEYVDSYNKNIEIDYLDLVDPFKNLASKHDNIEIWREKEDFINFRLTRNTSIINFSYSGAIKIINIGSIRCYEGRTVNGILFTFNQNDTGRFNTAQELVKLILTPSKKELEKVNLYFELDLKNRNANKTSNIRNFKNKIRNELKEYLQ